MVSQESQNSPCDVASAYISRRISSTKESISSIPQSPDIAEVRRTTVEIWGIRTKNFPYTGYLPVKLTVDPSVSGKAETFDTLAVLCPCPPGASKSSLIIGTNTDLI